MSLAVGDVLGTTVEFEAPGSFPPITDMVGGGWLGLIPGEWTDDTSLALCLAESLIECQGFDSVDQLTGTAGGGGRRTSAAPGAASRSALRLGRPWRRSKRPAIRTRDARTPGLPSRGNPQDPSP